MISNVTGGRSAVAWLTTFWLACSRDSRRPGDTPASESMISEASATAISAIPAAGEATDSRLPATASAMCQAWATAQLGRHQKVSTVASRRAPRSSCASDSAARRSELLPAARPPKPVNEATVSAKPIGCG